MKASPGDVAVTRRTLIVGGAAAAASATALPAWARTFARTAAAIRKPGSLPFPHLPAGTPTMPKIQHIVVLMMENHSFDNLLGMVPAQVRGRSRTDGFKLRQNRPTNTNPDAMGNAITAAHAPTPCQQPGRPTQSWNASHQSFANGLNDGFVQASGPVAISYWDGSDLPFTYSLVRHYPIGQRYFCSVLAQTYPNRRFFFTGTASGTIATDSKTFTTPAVNGTIWDRLDAYRVNWAVYYQNLPSWLIVPGVATTPARLARQHAMAQFFTDAATGRLPQFSFLDPDYVTTSEENPQDIQVGEQFIASVVKAVTHSPAWRHTALLITYDEGGGYYDHVPPPRAIKPDSTPPILAPGDAPGGYDRYGFRVPLIVVSPYARPAYVSNQVQDHTSITAFIERKWNLPAMTFRDANAHPMTDYFDFRKPAFLKPPKLKGAPPLAPGLARCLKAGLAPPLPSGTPLPPY